MVQVDAINAFNDNYIWAIKDSDNACCWVVDPGDDQPVLAYLKQQQLSLAGILVTHHHWDHTDGIAALQRAFPQLTIYGPNQGKFQGITHGLTEGDSITVAGVSLNVVATPGHTLDHICYLNERLAFTGDTLFNAGCGRLFEGTATQMWHSFTKLLALPEDCIVYCTHEYTLANLEFAQAVEPDNLELRRYQQQAQALRAQQQATVPTTIGMQKAINPFARADHDHILAEVPEQFISERNTPEARFAALRRWKDNF